MHRGPVQFPCLQEEVFFSIWPKKGIWIHQSRIDEQKKQKILMQYDIHGQSKEHEDKKIILQLIRDEHKRRDFVRIARGQEMNCLYSFLNKL